MKLIPRLNDYNHQVVDCPFCAGWVYVCEVSKNSPDPLRNLKRHITNQAKSEAFAWNLGEAETVGKHFLYFKEHTAVMPPRTGELKRQYDADLNL